jgi:hypothetical protein
VRNVGIECTPQVVIPAGSIRGELRIDELLPTPGKPGTARTECLYLRIQNHSVRRKIAECRERGGRKTHPAFARADVPNGSSGGRFRHWPTVEWMDTDTIERMGHCHPTYDVRKGC